MSIAFVCATNNDAQLRKNLLSSKIITSNRYPLILQQGYTNISRAYNDAIKKTSAEILVFLHQDVWLPDDWEQAFLNCLEIVPNDWGVLGVAGVCRVNGLALQVGRVKDRGSEWGGHGPLPAQVDALDELLLVIHNDGQLTFDERIPSTHFYGADICLQARLRGLKCYAIDAYCHHNSTLAAHSEADLPPGFLLAERYIRRKWRKQLPISTTSALLLPRRTLIHLAVARAIPGWVRRPLRPIYHALFPWQNAS